MVSNYPFHSILSRYINGGCLGRRDVLLSSFAPGLPYVLNAKKVAALFARTEPAGKKPGNGYEISLETYQGPDPVVQALGRYLHKNLRHDLYGAYIHGSLALDEKVAYSDLDALVIIKDDVFRRRKRLEKVAYTLKRSLKYFYKIDPLQHHGWFTLAERDLSDHPQTYFPRELFAHAKSLLPDQGLDIKLCVDPGSQDYEKPFRNLAASIGHQLERRAYPANMYQLKGLLSRFMLLPALYCQAKYRRGMFKKFSFAEARKDFPPPAWSIMDDVSAVRREWHYSMNGVQRYLMTRSSPFWVRLKRTIGPGIPDDLKKKLSADFYQRILDLVGQMDKTLQ
jgi:hypothetical protein